MTLLESKQIENFLTPKEVKEITRLIESHSTVSIMSGDYGAQTTGPLIAKNYNWEYHDPATAEIRAILDPKFEQVFGRTLRVQKSHILEATVPFMLHGDYQHPGNEAGMIPEYTIIIPLGDYNSSTVVFNEWIEHTNDFKEYRKQFAERPPLQLDPKFCVHELLHLDPVDLYYLTLKEVFPWRSGSLFAMDRRYFHCSSKAADKRGIVMWTYDIHS
jgi:hypothetical protein